MLMWQPAADVESPSKYSNKIKTEPRRLVVRSCHLRHICEAGTYDTCLISVQTSFSLSRTHAPLLCVLRHLTVKCLSDNAELCYLSHITTCQMFPDRSYLKKKKKRKNSEVEVVDNPVSESVWLIMLNVTLLVDFLLRCPHGLWCNWSTRTTPFIQIIEKLWYQ